ncbi:hypothetical protein [Oceanobacillus massiliensis]|uniref:hypothetical protein n=1 Tax=Oceanobacillus massiliensis TaxID=1465765 RepID=UPI00028A395C|nr:hypothetical protein [Oceanobacillus massiliensis]
MGKESIGLFYDIVEENERRIHYQIHKLGIYDMYSHYIRFDYNSLEADCNTYYIFQPDQGILPTYFNHIIRNRLFDLLQLEPTKLQYDKIILHEEAGTSSYTYGPIDPSMLQRSKSVQTSIHFKWFYQYVQQNLPIKEIAELEGVPVENIKYWGNEAKRELRGKIIRISIPAHYLKNKVKL